MKDWGCLDLQHIKYAADWRCQRCGFEFSGRNLYNNVCGFSESAPIAAKNGCTGGMIVTDCPQCQSKSWFHVDVILLENLMLLAPNWPKD